MRPRLSRLIEMANDSFVFESMIRIAHEKYGGVENDLKIDPHDIENLLVEARKKNKERKKRKRIVTPLVGYWGWAGYYPYDSNSNSEGFDDSGQ